MMSFHKYMASSGTGQPGQTPWRLRDWFALAGNWLPGTAAVVALVFAYLSLNATHDQLQIAEQGQITDRYNAAITNLGSHSIDIRLGGIYALQRLMQDSPRDQPTVIAVLCAFVRDRAPSDIKPKKRTPPPADIQAALTVVGTRRTANDGRTTVVDFDHTQLANTQLSGAQLSAANFRLADLTSATLTRAHLTGAVLSDTDLMGADLTHADLFHAHLNGADLTGAFLDSANLWETDLLAANLTNSELEDAIVTDASLPYAKLAHADLARAHLTHADLFHASLNGADLTGANLTDANLTGANLRHAKLTGVALRGANLTGALWPTDVAIPAGWQQDTRSGRLKRVGTNSGAAASN
jgi:uncharacterized protein YjbI with pentapeptide repeats